MHTCAVVLGASTLVKVEADLFPIAERSCPLGPTRPVCALLAGLLEYKEHSDLFYGMQIDRGSREHLLLFSWLQ